MVRGKDCVPGMDRDVQGGGIRQGILAAQNFKAAEIDLLELHGRSAVHLLYICAVGLAGSQLSLVHANFLQCSKGIRSCLAPCLRYVCLQLWRACSERRGRTVIACCDAKVPSGTLRSLARSPFG